MPGAVILWARRLLDSADDAKRGISPASWIRQMTLSARRQRRYNEAYAVMD